MFLLRAFLEKARLDVSPKPRVGLWPSKEPEPEQDRLRRPSGGVRHVAGGWGKSTPSHQPGAFLVSCMVKGALRPCLRSPHRCDEPGARPLTSPSSCSA